MRLRRAYVFVVLKKQRTNGLAWTRETAERSMAIQKEIRTAGGSPFGRIPSLTAQIRELIHDYPEGIGIIKELAQNADDAGARTLEITIDKRRHPTDKLPASAMAALQGPALLFYNDRVFIEEDFDRIQEIYRSGKVRAADKTGQFGKGFNTVYNVTDWPGFVTGERVAIFDPHCSVIPDADRANPGRWWTLAECWERYPDLLTPFGAAGLGAGVTCFEGTIFRLPFRTPAQAVRSEISRKPFGGGSLRGLIDELADVREALLLFLKRLETIRLREVLPSGEPRDRIVIETANAHEVREARQKLLEVLDGDALAVIERLRGRSPVLVSYQHCFRSSWVRREGDDGAAEDSAWRVVHCLNLDREGKIAEAVENLTGSDVKAVPLGGAAARLVPARAEDGTKGARGKVYCSLPLPVDTGLPVHLNGFFDLDSSRHSLTAGAGLTGSAKLRARWNQLLMEHVVAPAYAHLIDELVEDLGDDDPPRYYSSWPRPDLTLPKPLDTLAKLVYQQLAPLKVIRVGGGEWRTITQVALVPAPWKDLKDPLAADGLSLPEPRLSVQVVAGFQKAGVVVQKVTPQWVRDRLCQVKPLLHPGALLAQAPRQCLRQRPWLETLLRVCLSDHPNDLTDLPLALMANGRLRSFVADPRYPIYAAGAEERALYADQPQWFLDQDYAAACGLTACPVPIGLYWMTPDELTRCLPAVLPADEEIRLYPDGDGRAFPTAGWLASLYRYLLKAVRGGYVWARDDSRKIPLVPDQTGLLYTAGNTGTPLLGQGQESKDLGEVLRALNVPLNNYRQKGKWGRSLACLWEGRSATCPTFPFARTYLVTGSPELLDAIAAFASAFPDFVWRLTGPDLVDTLASLDQGRFPAYLPDVHPPLLTYLAQPQWSEAAYRAPPDWIAELRRLRIFPTADGRVVDLEGDVFISGDFTPPTCVRSVTLLQTGPANAWVRLFDLADIPRLTRAKFIEQYLLPEYAEMGPEDKLAALRWLRDNLERVRSELEEEGVDATDIEEAVRAAPLVCCEDGEFRPAPAVYDPESQLIHELFGGSVPYPDRGYYAKGWGRWTEFFRGLDFITKPHAQDLLSHVDRLCEEAAANLTGPLTAGILQVFNHIEEHWAELSSETVEDDYGEDLATALRERAWLPAETSARGLKRWPGAVAPESRLYRPDELYLSAQGNLVASQCPIFPQAKKAEAQRGLGFPASPPLDIVLLHFEQLLHLWGSACRPAREPYRDALHDVYRYLGGFAKGPEEAAIRDRFAGVACLWYGDRLWLSEHVFHTKVPFFGNRRVTVHVKEPVRSAYELLGMRGRPGLANFLSYLGELVEEFGTEALPAGEVERLLEIYRKIGEEAGRDPAEEGRFPLLTEGRALVDPQNAFYADAPWFQDRIKDARVQFLHRGLPVTITRRPWVRSLAAEVTERPTGNRTPLNSPEVAGRAAKLQALIRSQEFRLGVARLVYHEHGSYRASVAGWLARASVVAVRELTSELVLTLDGEDVVVGAGPSDHYLDLDGPCIYVDGNAGRLIRTFVSQAINSGLAEYRLRDLSKLADILDCEPREVDQTLTRLRIRPVDDEGAFVGPENDEEEGAEPEDADALAADTGGPDGESGGASLEEAAAADSRQAASDPADAASQEPSLTRPRTRKAYASIRSTPQSAPRAEGPRRAGSGGNAGRPTPGTREDGGARTSGGGVSQGAARKDTGSRERPEHSQESSSSRPPRSTTEVRMGRRGGRGRRQRRQRGLDRFVTYVSFGPQGGVNSAESTLSDEERRQCIALGDAAADLVCAFECEHERRPTKLAHNHPGWDIDSFDIRRVESTGTAGGLSRMIEVKGVRGPWRPQGVALSRCQFEAAQQYGDRYWLYVVEFADDPARARVCPIHNPFAKINQFWFDSGWRQLADPTEAPSAACRLTVGQRVTVPDEGEGVVERVEERGALRVVHVRLDDGTLVRKPFNPATMRPVSE